MSLPQNSQNSLKTHKPQNSLKTRILGTILTGTLAVGGSAIAVPTESPVSAFSSLPAVSSVSSVLAAPTARADEASQSNSGSVESLSEINDWIVTFTELFKAIQSVQSIINQLKAAGVNLPIPGAPAPGAATPGIFAPGAGAPAPGIFAPGAGAPAPAAFNLATLITGAFGAPASVVQQDPITWAMYYPALAGRFFKLTFVSRGGADFGALPAVEIVPQAPASHGAPLPTAGPAPAPAPAPGAPAPAPGAPTPAPAPAGLVINHNSIGSLPIGAPVGDLLNRGAVKVDPWTTYPGQCTYYETNLDGARVGVTTLNGRVLGGPFMPRQNGGNPSWSTDRGIHAGSTAAELRRAYPELRGWDKPNAIHGTEEYIAYAPAGNGHNLVFKLRAPGNRNFGPMPDSARVRELWVVGANDLFAGENLNSRGCNPNVTLPTR